MKMFIALYAVPALLVASTSADATLDDYKKSNLHRSLSEDTCSGCNFGTTGNCKHILTGQCWRMPVCSAGLIDCGAPECECSQEDDCPLQEPFCGASDGSFGVGRGFCTCYKCIRDNYPSGVDTGCPEHLPKCSGQEFDIPDCVGGTVCTNPDNFSAQPSVMPSAAPSNEPSAVPSAAPSKEPSAKSLLVELVAKLTAEDAASGDYFGFNVAVSGDTAVVGAFLDGDGFARGSAYVFTRSGDGTWTQQAKLTADDAAPGDLFGRSVAVSGDTAVVGAEGNDGNAISDSGSAYVFTCSGDGTWTQQAKLTADDAALFDRFGHSVAVSGDTAVVGAYNDDSSGSAYVFTRSGDGTWTQQAKLTAEDAAFGDQFGASVAVSGDTAVVGAEGNDGNAISDSGSAYVFTRSGDGTWTEQAKLAAEDAASHDFFGTSVAVNGDTTVVGAFGNDDNGSESGSAYVFTCSGDGTWTQQAKLTADDAAADDRFGNSVAVSGDTAVVGTRDDSSGSAYIFTRSGDGTWTQQANLTAEDAASIDLFGFSVAVSGNTAVVGAFLDDDDNGSGSAYVYNLPF